MKMQQTASGMVRDYSRALQQHKESFGSKDVKAQRRLFDQQLGRQYLDSGAVRTPEEVIDGHEDDDNDDGVGDDEQLGKKRPRRVLKLKFGKHEYCAAVHFKHEAMFNT